MMVWFSHFFQHFLEPSLVHQNLVSQSVGQLANIY